MVSVRFIPKWGSQGDVGNICGGIDLPAGYSVTVQHKFLLFEEELVEGAVAPSFLLVIGPVYMDYYHKNIQQDVGEDLKVCGGGYVHFSGSKRAGKMHWMAKFHDNSGDFGIFDPRILVRQSRQEIANALKMYTTFEWKESATARP